MGAGGVANPFGVLEDPIKDVVLAAVAGLFYGFRVVRISVFRDVGELRVSVFLKPSSQSSSLSAWDVLEAEERIAGSLGIRVELAHARIGVSEDGLLVLHYSFRSPDIAPLRGWER
ncbi:MAG: hypothetical protein DSY37_03080 [Hyperthermus sp.]|nr:MAG: hypothetical protein DSY37_03080 [Hyperthermus sp.]